jgi:phosphoglycolate phosphatase
MITHFDSLIFDLDGTLWDTVKICADSWNMALKNLNINFRDITKEDIEGIMGLTPEAIFQKVFPDVTNSIRNVIWEECFRQEIILINQQGGTLYPRVKEGLEILSNHYPLFIVSNCQQDYLEAFFKTSGLKSLFKDVETAGNTGQEKDENIKLISQRNHLTNSLYIGDTLGDQKAAQQAGVSFMHANYGFGKDVNKCSKVDSFAELVSLLS